MVSTKQIHKLMQRADPKTWDRDIWDSDDNNELEENSEYYLAPEPITQYYVLSHFVPWVLSEASTKI